VIDLTPTSVRTGTRPPARADAVRHAAEVAILACTTALRLDGAVPVRVFVAVEADVGDADPVSHIASEGFADDDELVAELLGMAGSLSKQIGLELEITPRRPD